MGRGSLLGLAVLALSACGTPLRAQEANGEQAIRVFLDCDFFCDFDHFRRMVPFVDYMRDRQDAQIHVLVTVQGTGGGIEITFNFIGLREYAGQEDTLRYQSSSTDTEDERRDGMVRTFTMGLMPFVAGTPLADRITIAYNAPTTGAPQMTASPDSDPWNFWVFRVRLGGFFNGESQSSRTSLNGSLSANRTTEEWKISVRTNGRYSRDRFDLTDSTEFVNTTQNYSGSLEVINSITDHWSVGFAADGSNSTFLNRDLKLGFEPAIEYNIFPYSESTRRQLTFLYKIGVSYFNYEETTIFGKDEETRPQTSLEAAYEVRQPWGSINMSVEASTFLHDLDRHRLEISGGFNLRIVRGLNLGVFGNFSRVKDQIHLSGAGIPDEERLLRRRQLGTDFSYFMNFNLSYTFGSIFNNVVNPRMDNL